MYRADRLPGVRIDTTLPPPGGDRFPRMDVAVFVGIAERGPCHRPVLVESVEGYAAVFGGAVVLARDWARGENLSSNLAASVRAFFSNGGTQCWVIRVAWAEGLPEAWGMGDEETPFLPAETSKFAVSGLVARYPSQTAGKSWARAALLDAGSPGSWADRLTLSARTTGTNIAIGSLTPHRRGVRFQATASLALGDLIEIIEADTKTVRYAKVAALQREEVFAAWCAAFEPVDRMKPEQSGLARLAGRQSRVQARLLQGIESRAEFDRQWPELVEGGWIQFETGPATYWLFAERVVGNTAYGRAFKVIANDVPPTSFTARRVTLDIRTELDGETQILPNLGLSPEAANSLFAMQSDAEFYAGDSRLALTRSLVVPSAGTIAATRQLDQSAGNELPVELSAAAIAEAFIAETASDIQHVILETAFIPLVIGSSFERQTGSLPGEGRLALERDGLVPFDHRLFVDPNFADLPTQEVSRLAVQRYEVDEERLFGIHAAYDIPGEAVGDASILAVPDASHPGWELREDRFRLPPPAAGTPAPANWRDHTGPCAVDDGQPLTEPNFGNFLDDSVEVLAQPNFGSPTRPVAGDSFRLTWSSDDRDVEFVLEEAARHDFADAVEIWRGTAHELTIKGRQEGAFYYRLRTERDGNISFFAARLVIVQATGYVAIASNQTELLNIHTAMLRLAAGSAALTAILSLPRAYQADDAQAYVSHLVRPGSGPGVLNAREARSLSYGALYHPWLAGGGEALSVVPADGAVAGHIARLSRDDGAWAAPANHEYADIVGLYPSINTADQLDVAAAKINMILPRTDGFFAHAARSLSDERDWQQIGTRRLFIMLRRMLLTLGRTYLFEPNGAMVRRAIERDIISHMDLLQRRGAFSGKTSRESYFVNLLDNAADRDTGRIIAELGVAPSHPLEFIEVTLVQQGARLTLAEAA